MAEPIKILELSGKDLLNGNTGSCDGGAGATGATGASIVANNIWKF